VVCAGQVNDDLMSFHMPCVQVKGRVLCVCVCERVLCVVGVQGCKCVRKCSCVCVCTCVSGRMRLSWRGREESKHASRRNQSPAGYLTNASEFSVSAFSYKRTSLPHTLFVLRMHARTN
jgi:hypothetical protein